MGPRARGDLHARPPRGGGASLMPEGSIPHRSRSLGEGNRRAHRAGRIAFSREAASGLAAKAGRQASGARRKALASERPRSPKAWRQQQAAQERKRAGSALDAGGSDARSKDSAPIEREELRSPGLLEKPLASAASSRPLLHSAAAGRTPLFRKSASRWQGARSPEAAALRGAVSGWRTNS